ncbi:MAG: hypothetical protein NXI20_00705 [bacterium]|nr:hypothetical protein [bacterium]
MEDQKPKSIKTIGIVIIVISVLMIFSNSMGALAWYVIGIGGDMVPENAGEFDPLIFLLSNYVVMCLSIVFMGLFLLVGGIYITKYKLWANRLVSIIAGLMFLLIWGLMIALSVGLGGQVGMGLLAFGAIINALFWSTPVVLLIRFLNRKSIKSHFV